MRARAIGALGLALASFTTEARADEPLVGVPPNPTTESEARSASLHEPRSVNADFAKHGDTILGVERASPIFVAELDRAWAGSRVTQRTSLVTFGETPSTAPIERVPRVTLDYAIRDRMTLGGSVYFASIADSSEANDRGAHAWGFSPRAGFVMRAGRSFALWPRAGLSYASVTRAGAESDRLEMTLDAALCIFPSADAAITLTPAIDTTLAANGPNDAFSTARFTFTAGLFGRFAKPRVREPDDESREAPRAITPARSLSHGGKVIISADRMIGLGDYAAFDSPASGPRWQTTAPSLTPAFAADHLLLPRFAADIAMGHTLTLGTAFTFNVTPFERIDTETPLGRDRHDFAATAIGIEPRAGSIIALGDMLAVWLRAGLTYQISFVYQPGYSPPGGATTDDAKVAHELDVSLDPELVWFLSDGFAVTIGPVLDATLAGGFRSSLYPAGLPGAPFFHVGGVAGALISF